MLADDQRVELEGVEGILVYRDSSLTNLYYYCSTRPAIVQVGGQYQLTLVRYGSPTAAAAGMLSFVVDLEPDPTALATLQGKLKGAKLVPMPWTDGAVTAAIIGGDPVLASPSLLGSNSVVIALGLSLDQYELLKVREDGGQALPISIVYSLSYEAMREMYAFSIEFDENRFRKWVQQKCSVNLLIINIETVHTFEELKQNGVIRISSVNQTGEEPPDGFKRAFLASLKSLLTPMPHFAPPDEASDGEWLVGYSCSTVTDIQNMSRRLDTNMQVKGAVTRKVYLQGPPDGLKEAMEQRGVVDLPTSGSFTQNLTIRCASAFDGQPLKAVQVTVKPGMGPQPPSAHVFNDDKPDEWTSKFAYDPRSQSSYTYESTLHFDASAGFTGTSSTGVLSLDRDRAFLDVVPEEYFTYRGYQVSAADDFPWDLLQSVTLVLKDPGGLSFTPASLRLAKASKEGVITTFAPRPASLDDVEFAATIKPLNGADFTLSGLPSGAKIFLNPFRKRKVTFRAAPDFDWQQYRSIQILPSRPAQEPLLWPTGSSKLVLNSTSGSVDLIYWFAGDRKLPFQVKWLPVTGPPVSKAMETTEASVVISSKPSL